MFLSDPIVLLILCIAVVTGVIYGFAFRYAYALSNDLRETSRKANPSRKKSEPQTQEEEFAFEDLVLKKRNIMNVLYAFFANLTTSFPLLGMFGTVLALVRLSGSMSDGDVTVDLFFSALNTTLVGLVCALIFKALCDPLLSVMVTANNKEVDTLLERNSERRRQEGGAR